MLRRRATAIRATGAKDELVRETYRLGSIVTNLPAPEPEAVDEATREIDRATVEIERIDRAATVSELADAASAARKRRRRLRSIRRRLLSEQDDLAA